MSLPIVKDWRFDVKLARNDKSSRKQVHHRRTVAPSSRFQSKIPSRWIRREIFILSFFVIWVQICFRYSCFDERDSVIERRDFLIRVIWISAVLLNELLFWHWKRNPVFHATRFWGTLAVQCKVVLQTFREMSKLQSQKLSMFGFFVDHNLSSDCAHVLFLLWKQMSRW